MAENSPANDIRSRNIMGIGDKPFLPILEMYRIWNSDRRLENFLGMVLELEVPDPFIIEFAKEKLLRTLSTLVFIQSHDWNIIRNIWFDGRENTDEKLPSWTVEELKELSGDPDWSLRFTLNRQVFTAMVIAEGEEHQQNRWTLPYTLQHPRSLGHGQNGTVVRQIIPSGHFTSRDLNGHLVGGLGDQVVAVKSLTPSPTTEEIDILRVLQRDLSGKEYFATYLSMIWKDSRGVDVLSPCADMDLHKFLSQNDYRHFVLGNIEYLIEQIQHIADALGFLHRNLWDRREMRGVSDGNPNGVCCHMDLKPENILVFGLPRNTVVPEGNTVGHWKLADFGVSKVSKLKTRPTAGRDGEAPHITVTVSTRPRPLPSRYQAPEVEYTNKSGRGSDVWSLGCICVEVIAAGLGFQRDLENMRPFKPDGQRYENDYFYHSRAFGASISSMRTWTMLKPRVKDWISNGFPGGQRDYDSTRQQYILTESDALLLSMLRRSKGNRPKAEQVSSRFQALLQAARGQNQPVRRQFTNFSCI